MPVYEYRALNARGRTVNGIIDAPGVDGARVKLKGRGLFVQSLAEAGKGGGRFRLGGRGAAAAHLTRQLRLDEGQVTPLTNRLALLIDHTEIHPQMGRQCRKIPGTVGQLPPGHTQQLVGKGVH